MQEGKGGKGGKEEGGAEWSGHTRDQRYQSIGNVVQIIDEQAHMFLEYFLHVGRQQA